MFGKSQTAYYKAIKRKSKTYNNEHLIIQEVFRIRKKLPKVGSKKLYHMVKPFMEKETIKCGRDKFYSLLKSQGLILKRKRNYMRTTYTHPWMHGFGNKIENLIINRSEQVWVSDITYIKTKERYKYLSLVTDAFSKKIMGHFLSDNLKTQGTINALRSSS